MHASTAPLECKLHEFEKPANTWHLQSQAHVSDLCRSAESYEQSLGNCHGFWDVTCDGCDGIAARILKCSEAREGLIVGKDETENVTDVCLLLESHS